MTFRSPAMLWTLAAVPLLLGAVILFERRRRSVSRRFASAAMMPNVLPRAPRWRRHVPTALYLLCLAALAIAAARPTAEATVRKQHATVVLAIDSSRSMLADDALPNRLEAAKQAARAFLSNVPKTFRVGIVAFDRAPRVLSAATTDRAALRAAIDSLSVADGRGTGGTAIGDGMISALSLLPRPRESSTGPPDVAVVLLTDGNNTTGDTDPGAAASAASDAGVPVFTVAVGSADSPPDPLPGGRVPEPADRVLLAEIARTTGARSFSAATSEELQQIYRSLGTRVSHERERREVTATFVAGALGLLLAGGLASAFWLKRIP